MNTQVSPFVMLVGACLMSGCGKSPPSVVADAEVLPAPKISGQTLESSSVGKPSVPVSIRYTFAREPEVGEPLRVRLAVESTEVSDLRLAMSTRGSIAMAKSAPAEVVLKSGAYRPGVALAEHEALVVPAAEGRSYLNLQITGMFDGRPFTKAVSIPVQVGQGEPVLSQNGEIIDTGVEVLSSMPARQQVESESQTP